MLVAQADVDSKWSKLAVITELQRKRFHQQQEGGAYVRAGLKLSAPRCILFRLSEAACNSVPIIILAPSSASYKSVCLFSVHTHTIQETLSREREGSLGCNLRAAQGDTKRQSDCLTICLSVRLSAGLSRIRASPARPPTDDDGRAYLVLLIASSFRDFSLSLIQVCL